MPDCNATALGDRTIVAVITPPGEGGIAALRLAGPQAVEIAAKHFRTNQDKRDTGIFRPWRLRYGYFVRATGELVDEVTAVYMPPGRSYTGEEQIEIFCHGGAHVVRSIQDVLAGSGAQSAVPGEFTKLAFLNGRIDLTRAEAVADLVAASTQRSYVAAQQHLSGAYGARIKDLRRSMLRIAADLEAGIDFPEEDLGNGDAVAKPGQISDLRGRVERLIETYEAGRMVRDGFRVAIVGPSNAGKSSLLNLLLSRERALVTPTPGTTRDYISEWVDLDGFAVELTDTAGIRDSREEIERAGQRLAKDIVGRADVVLWMTDLASPDWMETLELAGEHAAEKPIIRVGNKIDLIDGLEGRIDKARARSAVLISCKTSAGLDELKNALREHISRHLPDQTDGVLVTSARHLGHLQTAAEALKRAEELSRGGEPPELIAFEINEAVRALDEITGRIYNEEVLEEIFSRFCIGK